MKFGFLLQSGIEIFQFLQKLEHEQELVLAAVDLNGQYVCFNAVAGKLLQGLQESIALLQCIFWLFPKFVTQSKPTLVFKINFQIYSF